MIIYCLDNPLQHKRMSGNTTSIHEHIEDCVRQRGGEYALATDVIQCDSLMRQRKPDWVVIHHSDFDDIIFLKQRHEGIRYAGYSGSLLPVEDCRSGSMAEVYRQTMSQHYDYLMDASVGYSEDIERILALK